MFRGLKCKLTQHKHRVVKIHTCKNALFSLDEKSQCFFWDGASLTVLQVFGGFPLIAQDVLATDFNILRVCLVGQRMNWFSSNLKADEQFVGKSTQEEISFSETRGGDAGVDLGVSIAMPQGLVSG